MSGSYHDKKGSVNPIEAQKQKVREQLQEAKILLPELDSMVAEYAVGARKEDLDFLNAFKSNTSVGKAGISYITNNGSYLTACDFIKKQDDKNSYRLLAFAFIAARRNYVHTLHTLIQNEMLLEKIKPKHQSETLEQLSFVALASNALDCFKILSDMGVILSNENAHEFMREFAEEGNWPALNYLLATGINPVFRRAEEKFPTLPLDFAMNSGTRIRMDGVPTRPQSDKIKCAKLLLQHALAYPNESKTQHCARQASISYPDVERSVADFRSDLSEFRPLFVDYDKAKKYTHQFQRDWNNASQKTQNVNAAADQKIAPNRMVENSLYLIDLYEAGKRKEWSFGFEFAAIPEKEEKNAYRELRQSVATAKTEQELIEKLEAFETSNAYQQTKPDNFFRGFIFWLEAQVRKQEWERPMLDVAPINRSTPSP